ncbi:MAG: ComF family protein [Candidatus Falkowbacteria bacterium]
MKNNIHLLFNHAKKTRDFVLDMIFPLECLSCGMEGEWLCEKCFRKIEIKETQYCLQCKKENKFGEFCDNCNLKYSLDGVLIAGNYEDEVIAKLIKSLKYHFARDIAEELSKFLILFLKDLITKNKIKKIDFNNGIGFEKFKEHKNIPNFLLNFKDNLIIPVPLHKKRERWRGFNQAELIAKIVARYFNLDFCASKLVRVKYKKPQAKLGERDRLINILECFKWVGEDLRGRNIIIVDDVATTGSTLNECSKVLKASGAGEVFGLVVAKG